jgi:hypothetical protein
MCGLGRLLLMAVVSTAICTEKTPPVAIIIDTDMSTDVDDVAAVCMTHALADRGEAELLAIVHNTGLFEGVGAISVINHWYGRDHVPVGAYKGVFGATLPGKYVLDIVKSFESPIKNYSQVPDAVDVYRTVLAKQTDRSVTISSIGFMTNLKALLASKPDTASALNGVELVRRKVKRLVWMGGKYPNSGQGWEWNFGGGGDNFSQSNVSASATNYTLSNLPAEVEVIFNGGEVGGHILSGGKLSKCVSAASPCRQAFADYGVNTAGHSSFDPATTLMGIRGVPSSGCAKIPYSVNGSGGYNTCDPATGKNAWLMPSPPSPSNQTYVELLPDVQISAAAIGAAIDELLCASPKNSPVSTPAPPPALNHQVSNLLLRRSG